ncbi:putative casparian strip membrane protein [Helianthus annuus]|nr:putative casparian strip membrane protein [Helianthus annuus]KAJ0608874.1 putative casparian strip membrane protein [Helianthus annuus]
MARVINDTTAAPPHASVDMEVPVKWSAQGLEQASKGADGVKSHLVVDAALRAVVFAASAAAVVVMVTSKQSKMIPVSPTMAVSLDANWNQSPAYIYYVSAFSVAGLYSIITGFFSVFTLKKTGVISTKMQFHLAILDSLLLSILSSAIGAELGVAYVGLKGNSHSFWKEICNAYGSFCHHLSATSTMAIISDIALLLLVWLSYYTLLKKIARP